MLDSETLNEIQELNMTYLLLAKQLLSEDREAGIFRLGVTEEVADYILSLSAKKLAQISRTSQFICTLRIEDVAELEATVASHRDYLATPSHQAMLLASKAAKG
ncbi:flagellar transcriptional regulator FlhD [Mangrovimicrobium sediminis]|nr:flagellar transcriptional regulator FlhD [Haliea sp. SAOS-164]